MRVQIDTSGPVIIQHKSDTGFDNLEVGRAVLLMNNVRYRAKFPGTDGNGMTVSIRVVATLALISAKVTSTGIEALVPTGTTNNALVAAINALPGTLIVAHAVSNAAVITNSGVLASGLDPTVVNNLYYRYVAATGIKGGLFFNYLNRNQYVTQIEGAFTLSGNTAVTVQIVSLNEGFEPITEELGIFYSATLTTSAPSFVITDLRLQLAPLRAIWVVCAAPGNVRVQFQQAAVQTLV